MGRKRWPHTSSNRPRRLLVSEVFRIKPHSRRQPRSISNKNTFQTATFIVDTLWVADRSPTPTSRINDFRRPFDEFGGFQVAPDLQRARSRTQNVKGTATGRFCRLKRRHKNTGPKIRPGGWETRPGAQGKRPKAAKSNRNSGTMPRLEGDLHQSSYRKFASVHSGGRPRMWTSGLRYLVF